MPLSPQSPKPAGQREESVGEFLDRTNLQEFRQKAVLYGLAAAGGLVLWIWQHERIPIQIAIPLVGGAAVEAFKNIWRWHEWLQANPGRDRIHPDRQTEIE